MPGERFPCDARAYIVKPLVYEELEQKLSEAAAEILTTQENDKYSGLWQAVGEKDRPGVPGRRTFREKIWPSR